MLPSYMKSWEEKVAIKKAGNAHKSKTASMKDNEPLNVPRNIQQLKNLCFKVG